MREFTCVIYRNGGEEYLYRYRMTVASDEPTPAEVLRAFALRLAKEAERLDA